MNARCPSCNGLGTLRRMTVRAALIGWACGHCRWTAPVMRETRRTYKEAIDWWLAKRAN